MPEVATSLQLAEAILALLADRAASDPEQTTALHLALIVVQARMPSSGLTLRAAD